MRDGRLVIPVAHPDSNENKGIVVTMDRLAEKTVFIEPAEVVEANNHIRELEGDERGNYPHPDGFSNILRRLSGNPSI